MTKNIQLFHKLSHIPGQHDSSINIQIVHTATTHTDLIRIIAKNDFSPFLL